MEDFNNIQKADFNKGMKEKDRISQVQALNEYLTTSKSRSYFVAVVTFFSVFAILLFGIRPAISSVLIQNTENKKRSEILAGLDTKLRTLEALAKERNQKQDIINLFNGLLPENDAQEIVISDLDSFEKNFNLQISDITFSASKRDTTIQVKFLVRPVVATSVVSISATGEREDIINFINAIENSKRIYNIDDTTISRVFVLDEQGQRIGGGYNLSLSFQYFFIDNTTDAPVVQLI